MKGLVLKSLAMRASSEMSSWGIALFREIHGWRRVFHTGGVTCISQGLRRRFNSTNRSDPERVAQNMRLCDPFRVGVGFSIRSGGVAPGLLHRTLSAS